MTQMQRAQPRADPAHRAKPASPRSPAGTRRVAVLATGGALAAGLYQRRWTRPTSSRSCPSGRTQQHIDACIDAVKAGDARRVGAEALRTALARVRRAWRRSRGHGLHGDSACRRAASQRAPMTLIDSTLELARATVSFAMDARLEQARMKASEVAVEQHAGAAAVPGGRRRWLAHSWRRSVGFAWFVGQIYLSVVNMAAVPLLVVATFFGLRQVMALPRPGCADRHHAGARRWAWSACARLAGALAGLLAAPARRAGICPTPRTGSSVQLVLQSASDARRRAHRNCSAAMPRASRRARSRCVDVIFPDNFYRVLARRARARHSDRHDPVRPGVRRTVARADAACCTACSRASTAPSRTIIAHANLLLPVLAFGTAAHLAAQTEHATLERMSGFLLSFVLLRGAAERRRRARDRVAYARSRSAGVISALKPSVLVGLMSGSATAPIPHTIEAMSTRLGFQPRRRRNWWCRSARVFVRAGSALYFALATVFVAEPVRAAARCRRTGADRRGGHGGRVRVGGTQRRGGDRLRRAWCCRCCNCRSRRRACC